MSLSKFSRFSGEELELIDSWNNFENFSDKDDSGQDNKTQLLTVEEIETMQQQAYQEAFEQGRQEGFKQGQEEGVKQGKEAGFKQGFEEGAKKGYDENLHLLKQQVSEFVALMESLSEPFKQLDETVEKELVNLSIGIASQLLRRELKIDAGQVVAVVREAVNALPVATQKIMLKLHPEDAELVRKALKLDEMSPSWVIEEDPLLTRGGCIVETGVSHVDATVENRLAAIVTKILGGERQEDRLA